MASKQPEVNRDFVRHVGGQVLAAQLAGHRDPASVQGDHLDKIADLSVRAALALDAAIPRAEERLAAEAKTADEAVAAEKAAAAAKEVADKQAAKDEAAGEKAAAKK